MDLQNDTEFQALNVQLVSIAFDNAADQLTAINEYGIESVPMLIDSDGAVSEAYDVLQFAVRTGEPGHTFVLVNAEGTITWIKDYGSPNLDNPVMYVDPGEIARFVEENL